ncbi:hypothetical protein HY631_00410 [Candidatus Uhrbacteria bacterium]|nr:hypothetical protein [Candidatus Uhrbacteria bacterium]
MTALIVLMGFASPSVAVAPTNIITYQGRLLDANAVPVTDTSLSMKFFFYTALTGGTCVWSNSSASCDSNTPASTTARSVTLTSGLFTQNLGDTSDSFAAIGDSIFADNTTLFLEVIVGSETLSPRRRLTAAPYALNAGTLDGIDSATLQLFETGSSRTFEDDAPVIIGSNAAFTYGSGAAGDLRIDDELEVMGDGYIDNDLVVGASTSSTETITNVAFSLGGDDLFVAGTLGVEGTIYTDGSLDVVGTASVGDLTCTDCLDFTELSDTLALDASTSIAMDGAESFTITNSGTEGIIFNLASTGDFTVQDNGTSVFGISDTGAISVDPTTAGTALDFELATQWTTGDLVNADWGSATTATGAVQVIDLDLTNLTADASNPVYGIHVNDPASATASTERGIFIEGTNWDLGLYVVDAVDFDGAANIADTTAGSDVAMGNATGNLTFLSDNADFTLTDATDNVFQLLNATNGRLYLDVDAGATDTVALGNTTDVLTLAGNGSSTIDFAEFDVAATGAVTIAPTTTGTMLDFVLETEWTTGDLVNADWGSATTATGAVQVIDLDLTNLTADATNLLYGIHLNDPASATASTERGIFIEGTNWDRALYVEDVSEFQEDLVIDDATDGVDIVIGSDNGVVIDIGADVYNGGTLMDIAFDTAEVVDSPLTAMNVDFNTNLTGNAGDNVTAFGTTLPGFTGNLPDALSTTTLTGFAATGASIDTGTNAASALTVNWRGLSIDLPSIDTGSADDTVRSTGLLITGGTVTNGAGTEDEIGVDLSGTKIDLDADNDTSFIASTDDRIDWELGGTAQTLIMSAPAAASSGTSTSILQVNYATPADGSGTNIHQALALNVDIGNATAGTNTVNVIEIMPLDGDADVANVHAIDIGSITGTSANNETAIQIGPGWDMDIVFLNSTQANFRIANSSSVAFQDASGNEILSLEDVGNAVNHVITIDGDTGLAFDSSSDSDTDITTATDEDLRIEPNGAGDTIIAVDADTNFVVAADAAPAIDMISITATGAAAVTTTDVNAISLDYSVTGVSSAGVLLDSTFTGGGTDLLSYSALLINDINPTNTAGTDTVVGIDISPITDPGATITSYGMQIGSGYDANLIFTDTTAIVDVSGGGTITFRDGTNTLMAIADNGTDGILTINNLSTAASAVNIYDVAVTKSIDIGGVTADAADTVSIATNASSGDTILIGNSAGTTNVTITAGGTIDLEGSVTMDLTTIGATQFAVCHTNSDTNDEAIGDCSGAPTADYAEQYPVAAGIGYGDIVVPGAREVTTTEGATLVELVKSSTPYEGPIVGIVSNNYGDFTSAGYNIDARDNPMPVALVGRVPVKVVSEGGAIAVGDYLTTSSTPGMAMKASKLGRVIGMALEDWDGISDTVMVQVNNSWSLGSVIGEDGVSTLATERVVVSSFAVADAQTPTFDSFGLSLRGSAWDGAQAQAVEMLLQNTVVSEDDYRLSVKNTSETEVAYITNEGTMKIAGDLVIGGKLFPSDRGATQTEKYIYYDGSQGAAGDFMRTNAKGWSTGSYDFAEMFPSPEALIAGEAVVFSGVGHEVVRATWSEGEQLAGIVSTRPGFLAGENVEGSYPIALAGRVPTRVSTVNGSIAVGDPLAPTGVPGVSAKASRAGQIVGYALETYEGGESDDLILTYVNIGYWQEPVSAAHNTASGVSSTTNFSALSMTGNIAMNSYEISGIGSLTGMGSAWSLASDGTLTTQGLLKTVIDSYQNEQVETVAVTSPEVMITLTGTAALVEGTVEIRFEDVLPEYNDVISALVPIRVLVTPRGPVSLYVSESDQNHFVVMRAWGDQDVEFDWMVMAYRKGYEPVVVPGFSLGSTDAFPSVPLVPSDPSVPSDLSEPPAPDAPAPTDVPASTDVPALVDLPTPTDVPALPASPDTALVDPAINSDGGEPAEQPPAS